VETAQTAYAAAKAQAEQSSAKAAQDAGAKSDAHAALRQTIATMQAALNQADPDPNG